MVTIYDHFIPGCIKQCDAFFDYEVTGSMLDDKCREFMWAIDKSKLIDKSLGTIVTPFGVTDMSRMSTGLKTLIIVYLMSIGKIAKTQVNITEADSNIVEDVIEIADKHGIELIMLREIIVLNDYDIMYNGEVKCSIAEYNDMASERLV